MSCSLFALRFVVACPENGAKNGLQLHSVLITLWGSTSHSASLNEELFENALLMHSHGLLLV
jgi:hypothetical protein